MMSSFIQNPQTKRNTRKPAGSPGTSAILFGGSRNIFDGLRTRYFSHPLVRHLLEHLNEEWTRFGRLRALERACGGYEMVGRDEITFHTQNFYEWVEELDRSKILNLERHGTTN